MYGQDFYDQIRAGIQSSAAVVAPIVSDMVRPRTVLDVGCGEGWWAQAFENHTGHTVAQGVDGPGVPPDAPIREMGFTEANLAKPGTVTGSFDLVVCLEVAEHLPPRRAATFVAELCQAAPVVVFSAAIPGQGGTGHCFPTGTRVSGPAPRGSFARWYEGQFVKLAFASGEFLTATPNHPVLTDRGWVPIGEITERDHVVRCLDGQGITRRVPDDYQRPSVVEDVARSLDVVSGPITVPTAPEDFHGDGAGSEVHVVRTDGLLRDRVEAPFGQPLRKLALSAAGVGGAFLTSQGTTADGLDGSSLSLGPVDQGIDYALACLWRTSAGGDSVDFGRPASLNSSSGQHPPHLRPTDPNIVGDRLRALAHLVTLDKVNRVERFTDASHVYNLRTRPGWYLADGVIVHNCNEQWPGYWVDLFAGQGFRVDGSLRFDLWEDDRVENWYRQNLLLASVEPLPGLAYGPVLPVVHPVLYDARR